MSGYRDEDKFQALDEQTAGWRAAHYGFGFLAIGTTSLLVGRPIAISLGMVGIGAALVWLGWRYPETEMPAWGCLAVGTLLAAGAYLLFR